MQKFLGLLTHSDWTCGQNKCGAVITLGNPSMLLLGFPWKNWNFVFGSSDCKLFLINSKSRIFAYVSNKLLKLKYEAVTSQPFSSSSIIGFKSRALWSHAMNYSETITVVWSVCFDDRLFGDSYLFVGNVFIVNRAILPAFSPVLSLCDNNQFINNLFSL